MSKAAETLAERIDEKLHEVGATAHSVSIEITGNKDMIRDIRRKGSIPAQPRLKQLAERLGTTVDWLMGEDNAISDTRLPFRPRELPQDIPVYGTAWGQELTVGSNGDAKAETTIFETNEVIDWIRRPPGVTPQREIYALYVAGTSMEPRFDPGQPIYIDPKRVPAIGDDVIVQLKNEEEGEIVTALIKKLVRRTGEFVELEQYNPPITFKIENHKVVMMDRVIPWGELLGI